MSNLFIATIDGKVLTHALRSVRALGKTPSSILACVSLTGQGTECQITATDDDIWIDRRVPATNARGTAVVNARELAAAVATTGEVVLLAIEGQRLQVVQNGVTKTLDLLRADAFPSPPKALQAYPMSIELTADQQARIVRALPFVAGADETRLGLTGVHCAMSAGTLRISATDGRRLVTSVSPVAGVADGEWTLRPGLVKVLARWPLADHATLQWDTSPVSSGETEENRWARVVLETGTVYSRGLSGFPKNVVRVIPPDSPEGRDVLVILPGQWIKTLTDLVRGYSKRGEPPILTLSWRSKGLTVTAGVVQPDTTGIPVVAVGTLPVSEPMQRAGTLGLNPYFLLDALRYHGASSPARLVLSGTTLTRTSPWLLTSPADAAIIVIMQVRLRDVGEKKEVDAA